MIQHIRIYVLEIYCMSGSMLGSLISPSGSSHENKGVYQLLSVYFLNQLYGYENGVKERGRGKEREEEERETEKDR